MKSSRKKDKREDRKNTEEEGRRGFRKGRTRKD